MPARRSGSSSRLLPNQTPRPLNNSRHRNLNSHPQLSNPAPLCQLDTLSEDGYAQLALWLRRIRAAEEIKICTNLAGIPHLLVSNARI